MFRVVLIIITILSMVVPAYTRPLKPLPIDKYTSKYDTHFKKYNKRFFSTGMDWRIWKAQAVAESALNTKAVSPVGAKGLLQIMPATYKEIRSKLTDVGADPFNARWNVCASIYYSHRLWKQWSSPRPFEDRLCLTMASYNAGLGNPLTAQRRCLARGGKNCNLWSDIKTYAPEVLTWKYHETLGYVTKIMKLLGYDGY